MPTSVSNAPFLSAPIIAIPRTTALWSGSWWAPTKQTPPLTSAPIANPSARSDFGSAAAFAAAFLFEILTQVK